MYFVTKDSPLSLIMMTSMKSSILSQQEMRHGIRFKLATMANFPELTYQIG